MAECHSSGYLQVQGIRGSAMYAGGSKYLIKEGMVIWRSEDDLDRGGWGAGILAGN